MASSDPKPAAQEKPADSSAKPEEPPKPTSLGEDDEFEDFPVDGKSSLSPFSLPSYPPPSPLRALRAFSTNANSSQDWPEEETEAAGGSGTTKHLWEESWDDDDTNDDFSTQLKCVCNRDPKPLWSRAHKLTCLPGRS